LPIELVVHLPENASLELMGKAMSGTGAARRFYTPPVEKGKTYRYQFKATWRDNGNVKESERVVEVQAGQTVVVWLTEIVPSTVEQRVLELVNDQRKKVGAEPLAMADELLAAARQHAANMAAKQTLNHALDGKDFWQRIEEQGYAMSASAENIAQGATSPEAVVQMWMESPGHRDNMLNPVYRTMGVGLSAASNGEAYWAQVFATPIALDVPREPPTDPDRR
jgi:uncharacterized protein (TIGR03000 family)